MYNQGLTTITRTVTDYKLQKSNIMLIISSFCQPKSKSSFWIYQTSKGHIISLNKLVDMYLCPVRIYIRSYPCVWIKQLCMWSLTTPNISLLTLFLYVTFVFWKWNAGICTLSRQTRNLRQNHQFIINNTLWVVSIL